MRKPSCPNEPKEPVKPKAIQTVDRTFSVYPCFNATLTEVKKRIADDIMSAPAAVKKSISDDDIKLDIDRSEECVIVKYSMDVRLDEKYFASQMEKYESAVKKYKQKYAEYQKKKEQYDSDMKVWEEEKKRNEADYERKLYEKLKRKYDTK